MRDSFDRQPVWRATSVIGDIDQGLRNYMIQVYRYMAMGLGLTGLVAFFVAQQSQEVLHTLFATPLRWVVMLAPLGIVMFLGARINRLSLAAAQNTFWVYAAVMGVSLSFICLVYTGESIARLFFVTSSVFGGMSLYGYTTKRDLTQMGSFLMMGVLGIVIASLVNIFLQSSAMQMVVSILGVLIFTGLTAYDTQAIKEGYRENMEQDLAGKQAIFGALQLYLDFINLFLSLLYVFGDRR